MKPPPFDRAQIEHLARLAALSLSDAECEMLARELAAIVGYVEELRAVDTSAVAARDARASSSSFAGWREDAVVQGLSHEDALREAPRATDVGFAVPGFVSAGVSGAKGAR